MTPFDAKRRAREWLGGNPTHGEVMAVGPEWLVVKFDGPWRNNSYRYEAVLSASVLKGYAPEIRYVGHPDGSESFYDHASRCIRMLQENGRTYFPFNPFTSWVEDLKRGQNPWGGK